MKTKSLKVMILNTPLDKWNKDNRATTEDPIISIWLKRDIEGRTDGEYLLMTNKLRTILRDYGERVSISNSLVFEILDNYIKKSRKLKKVERENAKLKDEIKALRKKLAHSSAPTNS
jgi:hypothetical protein